MSLPDPAVTLRLATVDPDGKELSYGMAVALGGLPCVWAVSGDTDGIDGTEDNAGAVLLPDSKARADQLGISARKMLANNDGYSYFSALGDLVITGPTLTNVNDYRVILVL